MRLHDFVDSITKSLDILFRFFLSPEPRIKFDLVGSVLFSWSCGSELGLLTQLEWIELYNNALTGSLPSELSSLCGIAVDFRINCGEIECECCSC